ncbi:C5a anaphylatoxin chemotactic receptor 1-like [Hemibagrus wyckioides]|uniref:C5a anaphylatoxin chemotactic receptor 1-like n=1 Tax=Hemibagrus wyckioides TaxID=337641 RepID=UPI00266B52A9|nr:C5a anaphylatoxin chemotactic receptor 1-like [Hemibagrus wyckioides]
MAEDRQLHPETDAKPGCIRSTHSDFYIRNHRLLHFCFFYYIEPTACYTKALTMEQLNSSNSSLPAPVSTEYRIASSVMGVCFILGVPGNIAVMVRLAGWLKTDSFTPRLMLSLAVSDLLTLISLPVWILDYLHGWAFDLTLCKLLAYMVYLSFYCSVLCVILMSIQRYMQVLHPEKWNKLGRKGKKILLIGMWILSAVFSCYALVHQHLCPDHHCTRYSNDDQGLAPSIWELVMFVVAFTIVAYCYFHLYRKLNNSAFFSSNSFIKIVTRIVICFFTFWIPFQICNIVIIIAALRLDFRLLNSAKYAHTISLGLIFINSCVNPFLYAFSALALQQQRAGPDDT